MYVTRPEQAGAQGQAVAERTPGAEEAGAWGVAAPGYRFLSGAMKGPETVITVTQLRQYTGQKAPSSTLSTGDLYGV